jgi:hypothetical protein
LHHQTDAERAVRMSDLKLDGAAIEDLCLDYTLPGYLDVELKVRRPLQAPYLVAGGSSRPNTRDCTERLCVRTCCFPRFSTPISVSQPNGREETVTLQALPEYVNLVTRFTLIDGVRQQMVAFRCVQG